MSAELQEAQGLANSTQGTLSACTEAYNQQKEEAESLQQKLNASLAQLQSQVGTSKACNQLDCPFQPCIYHCQRHQLGSKGVAELDE